MMTELPDLSIDFLLNSYRAGSQTPAEVLADIRSRASTLSDENIWIHLLSEAETAPYLAALAQHTPAELPLYGIPFAIKDNIDLAGIPTTAGCPDYAYVPEHSASVVERLLLAGALPVGKSNLDQFATGLTGTRSPWGATRNSFNPEYISGGSSSGSAVAVARGLCSFALGTDTAGSGRVPAAFNNLVGIKPTRGLLSTRGVVPACRSLDCVTLLTLDCRDAATILSLVTATDPDDPYTRRARPGPAPAECFRFGLPEEGQLEFFGNTGAEQLFRKTVEQLISLGGEAVIIDFQPFLDAARLLYEGPWVAERYAAIETFIEAQPEALLPVTHSIIAPGKDISAVLAFRAGYKLQALKQQADCILNTVDFVLTPTAGSIYTIDAVNNDPVTLNSRLGYYTNFMNLLDYAAVAVPAGFHDSGLPFGVTLFAPAFHDTALSCYAARLHHAGNLPRGATGRFGTPLWQPDNDNTDRVTLVVCGAHMQGLPLNHQLTERGGRLLQATRTSPCYRLYALAGGPPFRPGLVRDTDKGAAIEVEVWELPVTELGSFMTGVPSPLGIGTLELEDGTWHKGFICEPCAIATARDITPFGGWRAFLPVTGSE
ncbi:MAG: allophanate hydrolase [Gammaproteobacteria bacterium]